MRSHPIVLVGFISFAVASAGPPEQPRTDENLRQFTVKRGHILSLSVPPGWKYEEEKKGSHALEVRFSPDSGAQFKLLITAMVVDKEHADKLGEEQLKAIVAFEGEHLLSTAVEKELTLLRLAGPAAVGYFYTLTDKRPELPPGEFRYMCQRAMAVGMLRLSVTHLTEDPNSTVPLMARLLKSGKEN
jgi:hypothetical protein